MYICLRLCVVCVCVCIYIFIYTCICVSVCLRACVRGCKVYILHINLCSENLKKNDKISQCWTERFLSIKFFFSFCIFWFISFYSIWEKSSHVFVDHLEILQVIKNRYSLRNYIILANKARVNVKKFLTNEIRSNSISKMNRLSYFAFLTDSGGPPLTFMPFILFSNNFFILKTRVHYWSNIERLINISFKSIDLEKKVGWWVVFYGSWTFVGYLMPNCVHTCIFDMNCKRNGCNIISKRARSHSFADN